VLLIIGLFPFSVAASEAVIDWNRIAGLKPDLKVLVQIKGDYPITLSDLARLARLGMAPADRDPGLVLGLKQAIFSVKLKNWMPKNLPPQLHGKLLEKFFLSGIYRVGFQVEKEGYRGPLTLEVTGPRNGFGKQLLESSFLVRPQTPNRLRIDGAGNRWYILDYPQIQTGETITLHFGFKYWIDMGNLLDHDLALTGQTGRAPFPPEILPYLNAGYKIDPFLPEAVAWARQGGLGPDRNVRWEYQRLNRYIKNNITYDTPKRKHYFGGQAVYADLDDMYQDVPLTLNRKAGACPDTSLLECAFLRSGGIPCRTAGRFGHFFTHLYVPGQGWKSTSVTPTGIPLIIAPGPDHVPYQRWEPKIPLKTVFWNAKIRIQAKED